MQSIIPLLQPILFFSLMVRFTPYLYFLCIPQVLNLHCPTRLKINLSFYCLSLQIQCQSFTGNPSFGVIFDLDDPLVC